MPRLSPRAVRILRWLAFLPAVVAVAFAGLFGAVFLLGTPSNPGGA